MKEGWIEKRTGLGGATYRVRFWAPNAAGELVPKSKSFSERRYGTKVKADEAAKTYLAQVMTEVRTGDYLAPIATTLGELTRAWLDGRDGISANTRRNYESALKHLAPEVAAIPIQQLKPIHLQRLYASARAAKTGAGILRQLHVVINASLAQAVTWELIRRNPASAIDPPAITPPAVRYWTPEQTAAFLQAEGGHATYGTFWTLLILTGMRAGEARALRWTDVDLERRTITITRTVTRDATSRDVIGDTTKTKNSRRTIPLPATCVELLRRHRIHQLEQRLKATKWETKWGELIFTNRAGSFFQYGKARSAFVEAVARTGLPELGMHGLRHSFASSLILDGIHPLIVAELLGDSITIVMRTYSHISPISRHDAVAGLDARIARLREDMPAASTATT